MIAVRSATADDCAAVQTIYELSLLEASWLPASAKQNTAFAGVSHGEVIHVAEANAGVVAGFVSVQTGDSFVHHLYVHPDARGLGVGQALLNSLQVWLPQPWQLKCVRKNVGALRFYLRAGWEEVGSGESEHGAFVVLSFRQSPNLSLQPTCASFAGWSAEFQR
ncbi:GNAT family N-acetyltransferase [Undibacterium sp. FT79W]|uniref:GNAT family N-acetyltransferase n=1 Tax=Undibacterium sp. FT79W TaxID=2762296 RepID=UPI00164A1BBA|nr:GNAT family N-acetyltransferase [Undibacterium sp. FT79W]MBC3877706.1 GNAT family N-acetyltransferase [Undibacterium sp. FT79W]